MRALKKLGMVILLISLFFVFIFRFNQITQNKHETRVSHYGLWESSTKSIVDAEFNNLLPERAVVEEYGQEYYYKSAKGLLGDKNFVILITLRFNDQEEFENRIREYTNDLSCYVSNQDDTTYYAIEFSPDSVLDFTDDIIYDGMYYNFEIVSLNNKENTITFLTARVWDYYEDQNLISFLSEIKQT